MKCPGDGSDLVTRKREGIELNICPQCQGVWMERRQVEKLVADQRGRSAAPAPQSYDEDGYHPTPSAPARSFVARVFSD